MSNEDETWKKQAGTISMMGRTEIGQLLQYGRF